MARERVGGRTVDARGLGGEGASPSRQRKLLPLLGGLFLLVVVGIVLLWLIAGDEDKQEALPAPAEVGRLTAGGTEMLPRPSDPLGSHVGERAVGKNLTVTSVNGDDGFFVGSPADRIYIEWGADVGENEPSGFQPEEGQKVNLAGPVERMGAKERDKLQLSEPEENSLLTQGAFVNANRVTAAR